MNSPIAWLKEDCRNLRQPSRRAFRQMFVAQAHPVPGVRVIRPNLDLTLINLCRQVEMLKGKLRAARAKRAS